MPDARILQGWKEIEAFTRESRPTLTKKGYPVRRDTFGSIWAYAGEIEEHRAKISENMRSNAKICESAPCSSLK